MIKRLLATLRYTTVVALVASAFVFSGCGDDDNGPTVFDGNILAFIKSDQFKQSVNSNADISFDSLVLYLDKYPDLETLISGTAEYTLFAPSNSAFINLTALPGLKDPDLVNPDIIKGVLAYHFVTGKKMQSDFPAGTAIPTNYTPPGATSADVITVNGDGTLLTGSSNKNIIITTPDQLTTNGVVHTTATVLIPNATGNQLASILGSLAATVLLGKDFTYMAYMIARADAGITDPAQTYTGVLAKGTNLTLLAIPNAVFVGTFNAANSLPATNVPTTAQVQAFITAAFTAGAAGTATLTLKNHVLTKRYTVAPVANPTAELASFSAGTITALSGKTLTVQTNVPAGACSCDTGILISAAKTGGGTSNAPIVLKSKSDIDSEASISNGVLHVVGAIIFP